MIKRYGIQTTNGRWYYVEDETGLFGGHPTWTMTIGGKKYFILGLQVGDRGHAENILASKIASFKDFARKRVKFSKNAHDIDIVWGPVVKGTSPVVAVAAFE